MKNCPFGRLPGCTRITIDASICRRGLSAMSLGLRNALNGFHMCRGGHAACCHSGAKQSKTRRPSDAEKVARKRRRGISSGLWSSVRSPKPTENPNSIVAPPLKNPESRILGQGLLWTPCPSKLFEPVP